MKNSTLKCPFDGPHTLRPEDLCPVCGDTGEIGSLYDFEQKPSNCIHNQHRLQTIPNAKTIGV